MSNKLIVVAGPTASGKTATAIALAEEYGGEIVSADSMQVYRGMDIGTAKASPQEQSRCPHHMLDVAEPEENYSVSLYVQSAQKVCDDIIARGKLPIVTGGTGLYIDSLLRGTDFAPIEEDKALRRELEAEYEKLGGEAMLKRLSVFDPQRAAKLSPADKRRIVRSIEVFMLTGKTATEHDIDSRSRPPRYDAAYMVLNFKDRQRLYDRIDLRVDLMVKEGLFDEVRGLLDRGIDPNCTAMQAIGYKEAAMALRGEIGFDQAAELIKQGSRRYAKRQLTWFRRREDAFWINWEEGPDFELARQLSREFLNSKGIS
ncbi:MAG: tRNA (adenosine(37)-N6)-dimethylallyltransferase MiaA [Oscillospiraceae bacterium]|nr:tRNA (adenosine(37)-N6)-dimethylallyltransferase MiaA [Oscillospiraceae bacterium]